MAFASLHFAKVFAYVAYTFGKVDYDNQLLLVTL